MTKRTTNKKCLPIVGAIDKQGNKPIKYNAILSCLFPFVNIKIKQKED